MDAPPARPQFPALAPQNLVITNTGGVIPLMLTCPANPGENAIVRGSKPVSQGFGKFTDFRALGTCPAPAQVSADITSLYTARYGVPPVGAKVFVSVNLVRTRSTASHSFRLKTRDAVERVLTRFRAAKAFPNP